MRPNQNLVLMFLIASAAWAQQPAPQRPRRRRNQRPLPASGPDAGALPQATGSADRPGAHGARCILQNASLTEVIDQLARAAAHQLHRRSRPCKGGVTSTPTAIPRNLDARNLLDQILRINGFGMVQDGDLYRIVPLKEIAHQPLHPQTGRTRRTFPKTIRSC